MISKALLGIAAALMTVSAFSGTLVVLNGGSGQAQVTSA